MKIFKRTKKCIPCIPQDRGVAVITAIVFLVIISVTVAVGLSTPVVNEYKTVRDFEKSKGAYYLSEAGQEDAIYRLKRLISISSQEVISLGGNIATTTITTVNPTEKTILSEGDVAANRRRIQSTVTTGIGESFTYGIWVGAGGVRIRDNAVITGNLFSIGPVCGSGTYGTSCESTSSEHENPSGVNTITGTVISSGSLGWNGIIKRIINQDDSAMYAGTIRNSQVSGHAYCNNIYSSSTSTCHTLPELTPSDLPITAEEIGNWEDIAVAGGSVSCTSYWDGLILKWRYRVTSSVNLGPKKIPCDLEIIGGVDSDHMKTVTLQGPVWVTGDISIEDYVNIRVEPTYVGQSVMLIADKPSDHNNSSTIDIKDSHPIFTGAPGGFSWVMLLSENSHALIEWLDPEKAIDLEDGGAGDLLLYARQGNIRLGGHSSVNQVTGYQLTLEEDTNVTYSTGLQNTLFITGPSGAWGVQDWGDSEN